MVAFVIFNDLGLGDQILIRITNSFQFNSDLSTQIRETVFEKIDIRLPEIVLHDIEVVNGQRKHFTLISTLNCELPFKFVSEFDPGIDVEIVLVHEAANDTRNAKVESGCQLDIHQILMPRQHEAGITILHEVYTSDVVTFEKYVLIGLLDQGLEQWTDPGNE